MRYRPLQYAEALHEAMKGASAMDARVLARGLARTLLRHRMLGKTGVILAAYEKLALRRQGMQKVRIETPSKASEYLKKEIQKALGTRINFEEVIDPALLAGVKILVDDELLIDASAKRQIDSMFSKK